MAQLRCECWPSEIIALNFQSTGLSARYDGVTQIGAVRYDADADAVRDEFFVKVAPPRTTKITLEALHGIEEGDVVDWKAVGRALRSLFEDALPLTDAAALFAGWMHLNQIEVKPVACYNAAFHLSFLEDKVRWACASKQLTLPLSHFICVMSLASHLFAEPRPPSLGASCLACKLEMDPDDDGRVALARAKTCARLYGRLKEMRGANGEIA